jgi:hypothetical protein
MEMNSQDDKKLFAEMVQNLRDVNLELTACKLSLSALKSQCSDLEQSFEAAARSSTQLLRTPREKYDIPLERLLVQLDEASSEWDLLRRLRGLNASKPVN